MLPSSHLAPINAAAATTPASAALLADAFSEFIGSAARLEESYRTLQGEVAQLRGELEQRNAALRASIAETEGVRRTLQYILDSLPCGVIVAGRDGSVQLLNPEARRMLEISSEKIKDLSEVVACPGLSAACASLGEDGEQEFSSEGAGGKRWLAVRYRTLRVGALSFVLLILREVTAQKKLEQEREAARNLTALAEMARMLAHEIRNPLASLELIAGLIEADDPKRDEWILHLRAGIRSLGGIVNNVLQLNSVGVPNFSRLSLGNALRSGVNFVRPMAQQYGVSVSLEDELHGMEIAADEHAIQQLILNLAGNAFRHTASGGRLAVTAKPNVDGTRAVLEFADSGCGIDPEYAGRIFDTGFSGSGQTPGLGLAVCKKIVEQHGGSISVSSRPQQGTTFRLEFPAQ